MPANNLTEDFDFSEDQHKLALLADLDSLQSAITTLRKRQDALETEPTSAAVFPSTFTPSSGRYAQTFTNEAATSFVWASSEGASVHGNLYQQVNGPATISAYSGPLLNVYTRTGEQLRRYCMIGYATHSAGTQNINCTCQASLPSGLKGWYPNAIEVDYRFLFPAAGSGNYTHGAQVYINNDLVKTLSTTIAATGGAIDTDWVTRTFTASDIGDYATTPGAVIKIVISATSPGVGQCNPYLGNLIFNWK